VKVPEISRLNKDAVLQEIIKKAPFYLPEWKAEDRNDTGFALSRIFSGMAGTISSRVNEAPGKHFLSFLEMLNFSLIPPGPARVPLSFVLSEGALGNVLIEASTQASAKGPEGETIVFETENNLLATPSKITAVYSVIEKRDEIFDHTPAVNGEGRTELFSGKESLQKHTLYIGDEELFNLSQGCIELSFEGTGKEFINLLASEEYALWKRPVEITEKKNGEKKEIKWIEFGSVKSVYDKEAIIRLEINPAGEEEAKENLLPITKVKVNGLESRWISCEIKELKINEFKDLKVTDLKVSTFPSKIPKKEDSILKVQGIGGIYYSRLAGNQAKQRIETISELLALDDEKLANLLQCSKIRAQNILEAARKEFYDKTGENALENNNKIKGIDPDFLFYNDVPVEVSGKEIYPFGSKPRLSDTFYIGSAEAFSKRDYKVCLAFYLEAGRSYLTSRDPAIIDDPPQLSWEYWDGESWVSLGIDENLCEAGGCQDRNNEEDNQKEFYRIEISKMPPVKPSRVNGKESCWIRARLVGGNYGKDYEIIGRNIINGKFCPPVIKDLKINYVSSEGRQPVLVLAENNLEFRNFTKELKDSKKFWPFKALPDAFPSVYFGFDRALKEGPMSLFIDIEEGFEYPETFLPEMKWQYLAEGEIGGKDNPESWKSLEALDETAGFTKKGMLQFVVPGKMLASSLFGSGEQYWIRALVTGDFFKKDMNEEIKEAKSGRISPAYAGFLRRERPEIYKLLDSRNAFPSGTVGKEAAGEKVIPGTEACKKIFEIFNIDFQPEAARELPPKVPGFYLNSVWAIQASTTYDEIIGSSSREPDQEFSLIHRPVLEEEIWVDEYGSIPEEEIKGHRKDLLQLETDSEGKLKKAWVRWSRVDDFLGSGGIDRHYTLDRTAGKIRFGNGEEGRIPPAGFENLKATYRSGGGKAGNLKALEISKLLRSIAFVDRVYNPVSSGGGDDAEQTDSLLKRAPVTLKHRNRATSAEDYEWLVKEASREVARVKVLPNFNSEGRFSTGWVTVVIVPEGTGIKPLPSSELKRNVKRYLEAKCPPVLFLRVIPPLYVRVDVLAEIRTQYIDAIPVIEKTAREKIADFLHPLTGYAERKGWNFGDAPCLSDIYSILEGIEAVDYVANVEIRYFEGSKILTLTDTSVIKLPEYALPYSGKHAIAVKWINGNKEG